MAKNYGRITADLLNLLTTEIIELIIDRTGAEDETCDLWREINNSLNKFFEYPEYNNYN
jgi:hypothetical protein